MICEIYCCCQFQFFVVISVSMLLLHGQGISSCCIVKVAINIIFFVVVIIIVSLLLRYYWSFFCLFIFGEQQLSRTSCGVSQRVEFCNSVKLSKNAAKYLILIRLLLMILYFVRLLNLYSVWILFFGFCSVTILLLLHLLILWLIKPTGTHDL